MGCVWGKGVGQVGGEGMLHWECSSASSVVGSVEVFMTGRKGRKAAACKKWWQGRGGGVGGKWKALRENTQETYMFTKPPPTHQVMSFCPVTPLQQSKGEAHASHAAGHTNMCARAYGGRTAKRQKAKGGEGGACKGTNGTREGVGVEVAGEGGGRRVVGRWVRRQVGREAGWVGM